MRKFVLFILVVILFQSCVSYDKLVLVQNLEKQNPNYSAQLKIENKFESYRIRIGDILYVKIEKTPLNLTPLQATVPSTEEASIMRSSLQNPYLNGYVVNDSGYLQLPGIGVIEAKNLTLNDIQKKVGEVANKIYENPIINVFLLNYNIGVFGEVRNAGRFPVFDKQINIYEALSMAGGLDDYADRERVKLIRMLDNGKMEVKVYNLLDQNTLARNDIMMHPNDVIVVNQLKVKQIAGRNLQWVVAGVGVFVSLIAILTR